MYFEDDLGKALRVPFIGFVAKEKSKSRYL